VARYSIKKSDISVEGFFAEPAFNLLHANSEVLSVVVSCLSDYCPIRGTDIRIEQDSSTVGNTNVVFKLHPLNGIGRISVDKAQIVLFSPHTQEVDFISRLSSSYFDAISEVLSTWLIRASSGSNFISRRTGKYLTSRSHQPIYFSSNG